MAWERADLLLLHDRDGNRYAVPRKVVASYRVTAEAGDFEPYVQAA